MHRSIMFGIIAILAIPLSTFAHGEEEYGRGNGHHHGTTMTAPQSHATANAQATATNQTHVDIGIQSANTNTASGGQGVATINVAPGAVAGGAGGSATQSQNASANNQGVAQDVNVAAPLRVAPAPVLPSSTAIAPPLFFVEGKPANAAGAHIIAAYLNNCRMVFGRNVTVKEMRGNGASGNTQVIFVPHANVAMYGDGKTLPQVVQTVIPDDLPADSGNCVCLGLIQVEALDMKAQNTTGLTPANDAGQFLAEHPLGFKHVYFVAVPGSVSYNISVEGDAKGAGIGVGGAGISGLFTRMFGLSAEVNNGKTYPRGIPAGNFLVIAGDDDIPVGAATVNLHKFNVDATRGMRNK